MSFTKSAGDPADSAEQEIIKISREFRAEVDRKALWEHLLDTAQLPDSYAEIQDNADYETLGRQFWNDFKTSLDAIEIHGSDQSFANAVEYFVDAANHWNRHIFSRVRAGRGEISRKPTNSADSETFYVSVDTWDSPRNVGKYSQFLDMWEGILTFCETSSLRTMQSMQFIMDYYGTLVKEVSSTFDYIARMVGINSEDRRLNEDRLDQFQYRMKQIEFGFDTGGAAWHEQRPTVNLEIIRRQREENEAALEREYRRQRAERAAEQQRIQAQLLLEEQQRKDREAKELEMARTKNQRLRWRIRDDSEQFGSLSGGVPAYTSISTYSKGILLPFAIFYEDDGDNSARRDLDRREKVPSWPRNRSALPMSPSRGTPGPVGKPPMMVVLIGGDDNSQRTTLIEL